MHHNANAQKSPMWRIARRPVVAGQRVIRYIGDFCGNLGHFGASLGHNARPELWSQSAPDRDPRSPVYTFLCGGVAHRKQPSVTAVLSTWGQMAVNDLKG